MPRRIEAPPVSNVDVTAPDWSMAPTVWPSSSVNQTCESPHGPATMPFGWLPGGRGNSTRLLPDVSTRPILSPSFSVNQIRLSGPAAMPSGEPGAEISVCRTPDLPSRRAILLTPGSVTQTLPSLPTARLWGAPPDERDVELRNVPVGEI